jgi:hypothetical protein
MKVGNTSFESVAKFKYFGMTLTNPNCIHHEVKNIHKSRECPLPFGLEHQSAILLSITVKIKTHTPIIFPVVLQGSETWSLSFRQEQRLMVFDYRVCGRYLGLRGRS